MTPRRLGTRRAATDNHDPHQRAVRGACVQQAPDAIDVPPGEEDDTARRPQRSAGLRLAGSILSLAAIGSGLAMVWHYSRLQRWPLPDVATIFAPRAGGQAEDDRFAQLARDLDGLKHSVAGLAGTQQQLRAEIAALQGEQQQLRQRTAPAPAAPTSWHSNPATLSVRAAPAPRRSAAITPARGESGETMPRREPAPLKLVDRP